MESSFGQMSGVGAGLLGQIERLERLERLDPVAQPLQKVGAWIRERRPAGDVVSGTPFGHPVHPAFVALPLGCWTSALLLDALSRERRSSRRLIGLGIVAALPAVASGLADWSDTELAEERVGLVHAGANSVALGCFAMSWWKRRLEGRHGGLWALAGAAFATVGGWLGGHLAYGLGVGVDTNAFETGPADWTSVGAAPAEGEIRCVVADGVRVVVLRHEGVVRALADRCSHRGGPLSEGELEGSCIVCPWHGSAFDVATGRARHGPASVPQPVYETRVAGDELQIRRQEPRGLRQRTVRAA